ncbi:MAG: gamma-glutamylcyclotransferase [Tuberibacillus sp.]
MPFVFVYGTFMGGCVHHDKLGNSKCVAEQAWVTGALYHTGEYYPAL